MINVTIMINLTKTDKVILKQAMDIWRQDQLNQLEWPTNNCQQCYESDKEERLIDRQYNRIVKKLK